MEENDELLKRYTKLKKTADSLNEAATILKRSFLTNDIVIAKEYPKLKIDKASYIDARNTLLLWLRNLVRFYEAKGSMIDDIDDVFETTTHKDQINDDAKRLIIMLESRQDFTQNDFQFWDRVITIMGNQKGILYQELRNA